MKDNPWLLWIRPWWPGTYFLNSTRAQNGLLISYGTEDDEELTAEEVGQLLGGN